MIIGFPIFATMIILGSWWASIAWSRYWGWDPKETAALVTWLTYAVYLHARNQRRWAGRPAALLLVIGFGMVLVTYSGSLWFSGLHAYCGAVAAAGSPLGFRLVAAVPSVRRTILSRCPLRQTFSG